MCRWITLLSSSHPVSLADIVLSPSNSLVQLSKDASFHPGMTEMNNHVMNGDGFGVGWFHNNSPVGEINGHSGSVNGEGKNNNSNNNNSDEDHFVALFKDTRPAWNNANLKELCMAVKSKCVVAHVRAASAFAGVISEQNCHPFKAGRLLFCHNGRIDFFNSIRRRIKAQMNDEAFLHVQGTTDSECIFGLILTFLSDDEVDGKKVSAFQQKEPFGAKRLQHAIKKALRAIQHTLVDAGIDTGYSTLNFCLTDGDTVVVTRYCDKSPQVPPPSLYFAYGNAAKLAHEMVAEDAILDEQQSDSEKKDSDSQSVVSDSVSDFHVHPICLDCHVSMPGVNLNEVDPAQAIFCVASCPLTRTHSWHPMPQNSIMWCTKGSFPEMHLLKFRHKREAEDHHGEKSVSKKTRVAHGK